MHEFVANVTVPTQFPLEMLERINLEANPNRVAEEYGFDFDSIKDLPHFRAQSGQVAEALLVEGRLTTVIATSALHTAVEKLAYRVLDDRMPTGDLVKAIETFKKVKDGSKDNQAAAPAQGVSLVINIPAIGSTPAKTIEVTQATDSKEHHATIDLTQDDFHVTLD